MWPFDIRRRRAAHRRQLAAALIASDSSIALRPSTISLGDLKEALNRWIAGLRTEQDKVRAAIDLSETAIKDMLYNISPENPAVGADVLQAGVIASLLSGNFPRSFRTAAYFSLGANGADIGLSQQQSFPTVKLMIDFLNGVESWEIQFFSDGRQGSCCISAEEFQQHTKLEHYEGNFYFKCKYFNHFYDNAGQHISYPQLKLLPAQAELLEKNCKMYAKIPALRERLAYLDAALATYYNNAVTLLQNLDLAMQDRQISWASENTEFNRPDMDLCLRIKQALGQANPVDIALEAIGAAATHQNSLTSKRLEYLKALDALDILNEIKKDFVSFWDILAADIIDTETPIVSRAKALWEVHGGNRAGFDALREYGEEIYKKGIKFFGLPQCHAMVTEPVPGTPAPV